MAPATIGARQEGYAMYCPNCNTTFVLRGDYSTHVQQCRPSDRDDVATAVLLARLNAAAARLHSEFGDVRPIRIVAPRLHSAA